MSVEHWWSDTDKEIWSVKRKPFTSATLWISSLTGLVLNPGSRGKRLASNPLSHDTASTSLLPLIPNNHPTIEYKSSVEDNVYMYNRLNSRDKFSLSVTNMIWNSNRTGEIPSLCQHNKVPQFSEHYVLVAEFTVEINLRQWPSRWTYCAGSPRCWPYQCEVKNLSA